jgi:hypothetical protein
MSSFLLDLTRGARVGRAVRATHTMLAVAALAATALPQAHAAGVSGQGTWQTTLQGRDLDGNTANGFEAYYDTALDITWLADANYAKTSGYESDGYMTWDAAQTWVSQLNINGTTGWRLPTLVDTGASGCDWSYSGTDCGYNVDTSTSELAHLYYVTLGNKGYYDASGNYDPSWGLSNTGPFSNVQSYDYWSGVEYAPGTGSAWYFGTYDGTQNGSAEDDEFSAWAVRPGDVAAVPEPQAYALLLAGLAVAGVALRRRHR